MCGAAAREAITAALTLTAKASSSTSSVSSASGTLRKTPTLFTSRSTPPISAAARSTNPLISPGRRASARDVQTRRPDVRTAAAASSAPRVLAWNEKATSAPRSASASTSARPRPVPPPVTTAIFPSSRGSIML
jgi:hypothetical protein